VLAVVIIATTIVTVEAFRTRSTYQATAKVAINNDNPAVLKLGDAIIGVDDTERIKTNLLLLRTFPLLAKVVVRLKLNDDPRFLEAGQRRTVMEAVQAILAKFSGSSPAAEERSQLDPLMPQPDGSLSPAPIDRLALCYVTLTECFS